MSRRSLVVILAVCLAVAASAVAIAVPSLNRVSSTTQTTSTTLPPGCVKPVGGFLIIASELGYNDSRAHGAPAESWPILQITQGTDVNITVCNTYVAPVGFQVQHYLQSQVETILPNSVVSISFVANETGSFSIYCAVFSAIHLYLQGGVLEVV